MFLIYYILSVVAANGTALYFLTRFVDTIQYTGGVKTFVLGGLILGVINSFVRPLMKLFGFPLIVMTAGLFLIVINMLLLWLLVQTFDYLAFKDVTLTFQSFSTYVIGAIVFGITNWFLNLFVKI